MALVDFSTNGGGTATSSNNVGGFEASKAFDGDTNSRWQSCSSGCSVPEWIKYQFPASATHDVTRIMIDAHFSTNAFVNAWELDGSNDDSAWTPITTGSQVNNGNDQTYNFTNGTAYEYYRLNITTTYDTIDRVAIVELQLWAEDTGWSGGDFIGVANTNIAKVMGVEIANITSVIGVT